MSQRGGRGPQPPNLHPRCPLAGTGEGSRGRPPPLTPPPHPSLRPPPNRGCAYLSNTAGVVLGLGAGPEQAGGCRGRPQLQDPAEVRGVGGGAAGSGGRWRGGLLSLGGQAELLGGPGEDRRAALRAVPVTPATLRTAARPTLSSLAKAGCGAGPGRSAPHRRGQVTGRAGPSVSPALSMSSPHKPHPLRVPNPAAAVGGRACQPRAGCVPQACRLSLSVPQFLHL